jgi:parvulin-like peptidyl-prolyl isomerase
MISDMRKKFGPWIVGIIVGFICFVFVFEFGMNRRGFGGLSGGSVSDAGTVNGEAISLTEFNRALNQRMEFFKMLGAGQMNEEMMKRYHIRDAVFRDLASRKLMVQEAERLGYLPSDQEVRAQIMEIPAFKKDGQFDRQQYKQVLEANNLTTGGFEKSIRDDLIAQKWRDYFKNLVSFSSEEVKHEYLMTADKRKIRYAMISIDAARKGLKVADADVDAVLRGVDTSKQVQTRYDAGKATAYKGKTFDQVKRQIAQEIATEGKTAEARKLDESLGNEALQSLTADASSDKKVNAALKSIGVTVQTSPMMPRGSFYIPGAGDLTEVESDAFSGALSKPKKYNVAGGVLVAVQAGAETADLSKFDAKERESLISKIVARKQNEVYGDWMKKLMDKAKIEINPALSDGGAAAPSDGSDEG